MNFEEISSKFKKIGKDTLEEVQRLNEIRILNGKISDANKQISSLYAEIGKKLYEQYKEEALEGYETEINSINENFALIEELKLQVRDVKGVVICPCCNMEVPANEKFCSNCGAKMPEEEEETTEEAADEVVEEAAEAPAEEVVETSAEENAEEAEDPAEIAEVPTESEEEK